MNDELFNSISESLSEKYKKELKKSFDVYVDNTPSFSPEEQEETFELFENRDNGLDDIRNKELEHQRLIAKFLTDNNTMAKNYEADLQAKRVNDLKAAFTLQSQNEEDLVTKKNKEIADHYQYLLENEETFSDKELDLELKKIRELEKERDKAQAEQDDSVDFKVNGSNKIGQSIAQFVGNLVSSGIKKIFSTASEVLDMYYFDNIQTAIDKSGSQYESNFTTLAGYNGSDSRAETHNLIRDTLKEVNSNEYTRTGLNFNDEIYPKLTEAVQNGFVGEDATAIAITNAIDSKIMPWLQTNSETWVQFQHNMSDERLQQLKGQQLLLKESKEGNRLLQSGVVDEIIDTLAPSLDNIDANTTEIDDLNIDLQGKAMYLMTEHNYSKAEAIKQVKKEAEAAQNPFKALTTGDTGDKMYAMDSLYGTNMVAEFAESMKGSGWVGSGKASEMMGWADGGETRTERSLNAHAGYTGQKREDYQKLVGGDMSPEELVRKYNLKKEDLNEMVTATQEHDNEMQNDWTEKLFSWNAIAHGNDLQKMIFNEVKAIKDNMLTSLGNFIGDFAGNFLSNKLSGISSKGANATKGLKSKLGSGLNNVGNKLGSGLMPGASKVPGAGKISFMKGGAGGAIGSAAGVTIGVMEAKAGIDAINEGISIKNDKTANSIQKDKANTDIATGAVATGAGVAGAGAILALGASNPIGWAALAIGGVALGIKAYSDHLAELDDATGRITAAFNESKAKIKEEASAREDNLLTIYDNIDELDTTNEKLQYLQSNGIETSRIASELEGKTTTEVNAALKEYLDLLIKQNYQQSEDAQYLIDDVAADFKNAFNADVDTIKEEILSNYSREALQAKGITDDAAIWEEQKKALSKLGYTNDELSGLYYHWNNGSVDREELEEFLDEGAIQGDNLGSFEDRIEGGKVKAAGVNYLMDQVGSDAKLYDEEMVAKQLGDLASGIIYLRDFNQYGREDGKVTKDVPLNFSQELYDQYKQDILNADKDSKELLTMAFTSIGYPDAMSDWPNSLKGFKIGSTYIQYDQIAQLHKGERVLTQAQNAQYTEELINSNSSGVIQAGVQDIVAAIQQQTKDIINAISTNSSESLFDTAIKRTTTLPEKSNTRVFA